MRVHNVKYLIKMCLMSWNEFVLLCLISSSSMFKIKPLDIGGVPPPLQKRNVARLTY